MLVLRLGLLLQHLQLGILQKRYLKLQSLEALNRKVKLTGYR